MNQRTAFASAMIGALSIALVSSPVMGLDDLILNVAPGSEAVMPGDTVNVTLDVANLSCAINGVQIRVNYDVTFMTLTDVAPTDLVAAGLIAAPAVGWTEVSETDTSGNVDWAAIIAQGGIQVNHTIATLTFTIINEGTTNVTFRPDAAPFFTKLTCASDNATVLPNTMGSGGIVSSCDDGLFCNGVETFDGATCQPGTDPCDDGIGCTEDICDEVVDACASVPTDSLCDNGLFCDGAETCDPVLDCQPATAPCDDGVSCTIDTCNEVLNTCANTADDLFCDNGLFCDGAETCDPVLDCQLGSVPCGDGVGCTVDTCDEGTDTCTSTPDDVACDNGLFCDGAETCDAVQDCLPGTAPDCNDGVTCTVDSCDETAGTCLNTPDDSVCDNGLFCDGAETCDALLDCQPGTDPCAPLLCDEVNDVCFAPNHVASLEVFYAGRFLDAPDPSHWFVASGSPATVDNITNYMRGITGIRVVFDNLVQFTTTPFDAFSFAWTTATGMIFSPVTNPSNITVTADDGSGVTIVTIVVADDYVRRRWLKVTIDATQVTAGGVELDGELVGNPVQFPSGDNVPGGDAVFHLGNITGDVDFDRKTTLTDIGLVRSAVNPFVQVPITNVYDVDNDGKVLLGDVGDARGDVNPFFALPLFTP